jgi:hypothetical protein
VERLVRASGLLGQLAKEGSKVLITSQGWLVKIDQALLEQAYVEAEEFGDRHEGRVGFDDFGEMLEKAVRARAKV